MQLEDYQKIEEIYKKEKQSGLNICKSCVIRMMINEGYSRYVNGPTKPVIEPIVVGGTAISRKRKKAAMAEERKGA